MAKRIIKADLEKAKAAVLSSQKADYVSMKTVLGTNSISNIKRALEKLAKQGVVAQGKRRRWLVLLNPDGTKKEGIVLPPKKRRRKIRRNRKAAAKPAKVAAAPVRRKRKFNGVFTMEQKLKKIHQMTVGAGPNSTTLLRSIAEDVSAAYVAGVHPALKD